MTIAERSFIPLPWYVFCEFVRVIFTSFAVTFGQRADTYPRRLHLISLRTFSAR